MTVQDLCDILDTLAPPALAYSWDKCGLHTGSPDAPVKTVLIALGVNPDTVKAARRAKADLIVSHHPLIWEPLTSLRTDDPHTRMCLDLTTAGIACYAAHTNLDVVPGGVNTVLAERLQLKNTRPLMPVAHANCVKLVTFVPESHLSQVRDAVCAAGAGVIGDYTHCSFSAPGTGTFMPGADAKPFSGKKALVNEEPERRFEVLLQKAILPSVLLALFKSHPYEEVAYDVYSLENRDASISLGLRAELDRATGLDAFAALVRKRLDVQHVRVTGASKHHIKHVAVMGGAGGSQVADLPGDIDVFVTGDVKYHDAELAAKRGIALIDAGHAGTEKWIVPAIAAYLRARTRDIAVKTYIEPDYFRAITQ